MSHWQFIALAYSVSFFVLALLCLWLGFSHWRLKNRLSCLEKRLKAAQKRGKAGGRR